MLKPLYNDGLHMSENEYGNSNKVRSACLKLDNYIVKQLVKGESCLCQKMF